MSDELTELQREWRNSVTNSIKSSELKMDLILEQLTSMRMDYVRTSQLEQLESARASQLSLLAGRVTGLETDRSKLVGAAFILNFIGGVVIYLVVKFWK